MLFNLILLKSKLLINLVLMLTILSSIFMVDCQAFQLVNQQKKFNYQQMSQADNQKPKRLINTDFNTQFQLKAGQIAIIKSANFELTFLDVIEDSRCPSDVNCFESGQIKVAVKVVVNESDLGDLNLLNNTSRENLGIKQVDDYLIKFVKAEPYPRSNQTIMFSDYIITLIVSKTPISHEKK